VRWVSLVPSTHLSYSCFTILTSCNPWGVLDDWIFILCLFNKRLSRCRGLGLQPVSWMQRRSASYRHAATGSVAANKNENFFPALFIIGCRKRRILSLGFVLSEGEWTRTPGVVRIGLWRKRDSIDAMSNRCSAHVDKSISTCPLWAPIKQK
jgi:hypothetical protein